MERSAACKGCKGKCYKCRPLLVLLLVLFLQFLLFAITIIISYAVESGVAHLHHVLFDLTPPLPLETSLMLYCVSMIAECITEIQHKNWTILSVKNHHIMLIVIPNIIYVLFFSLAFINIFIEFEAFHSLDHWHFGVPETSPQTALYMVSVSYMVFCCTRLIRKDLFQLFITLPHHQHSHSVVLLVGFVSQCIATAIYSIPIFLAGYIGTYFQWHVATVFMVMNSLGLAMGVIGSYVETRMPWPKKRRSKPYFWYENIIYSRVVLLEVILLPSFHYLFFEPGKLNFIHTEDTHILYFTFSAAISLIHVVKIISTALHSHGSAELIFGWAWGRPDLSSRNHLSQSGLDGGFLKEADDDDKNEDSATSTATEETNNRISNENENYDAAIDIDTQSRNNNEANISETKNAAAANYCEGGLPSFSFPRDLIQAPLSAIIFYGFKWIQKINIDHSCAEYSDDENIEENSCPTDNFLNSESSIQGDLIHANSILEVSHIENSNGIRLNNEVVIPGVVSKSKGFDINFNNNFRNQNLQLISAGPSK